MLELDLQLNELKKVLQKDKSKRYLLELPEGLKHKAFEIINFMTDLKKEFVLSIDTTFGACDIYETDLKKSNSQTIIHFGHNKYVLQKIKENIIYWPCFYKFDENDLKKYIKDIETKFKNKKITLVGPIQYKYLIKDIINELKKNKIVNYIDNIKQGRLEQNQILGCDCSILNKIVDKIDAIIYLGDGNFHFEALKNLKAYKYNFNKIFEEIEYKYDSKINYEVLFLSAKKIGIYVSSKLGQNKIILAKEISKKLNKIEKENIIIYGNEINNEKLLGLNLNLIINTACPRITDDYKNYSIAIIDYKNFLEIYTKYY
jgi:2-(3-amino-3-carboxypropyl)histidine synthase